MRRGPGHVLSVARSGVISQYLSLPTALGQAGPAGGSCSALPSLCCLQAGAKTLHSDHGLDIRKLTSLPSHCSSSYRVYRINTDPMMTDKVQWSEFEVGAGEDRGEGGGLVSDLPPQSTVTRTNSVFDTRCFVRVFIQSLRKNNISSELKQLSGKVKKCGET